jgi:hypothetical protein
MCLKVVPFDMSYHAMLAACSQGETYREMDTRVSVDCCAPARTDCDLAWFRRSRRIWSCSRGLRTRQETALREKNVISLHDEFPGLLCDPQKTARLTLIAVHLYLVLSTHPSITHIQHHPAFNYDHERLSQLHWKSIVSAAELGTPASWWNFFGLGKLLSPF